MKTPEVWITEYGFCSEPPSEAIGAPMKKQQATFLRQSVQMARDMKFVSMYVWFIFKDDPAAAPKAWEFSGGIVEGTGVHKQAYGAFKRAARDIGSPD